MTPAHCPSIVADSTAHRPSRAVESTTHGSEQHARLLPPVMLHPPQCLPAVLTKLPNRPRLLTPRCLPSILGHPHLPLSLWRLRRNHVALDWAPTRRRPAWLSDPSSRTVSPASSATASAGHETPSVNSLESLGQSFPGTARSQGFWTPLDSNVVPSPDPDSDVAPTVSPASSSSVIADDERATDLNGVLRLAAKLAQDKKYDSEYDSNQREAEADFRRRIDAAYR